VGNLFLRPSTIGLRHFLNLRSTGGIPWLSVPLRIGAVGGLSIFFENFAPPFPEKEPRDGTPKKVKKISIDFVYEQ
jgi:hypothetical protein